MSICAQVQMLNKQGCKSNILLTSFRSVARRRDEGDLSFSQTVHAAQPRAEPSRNTMMVLRLPETEGRD